MLLRPELTADKPPYPVSSTQNLGLTFSRPSIGPVFRCSCTYTAMAVSHGWDSDGTSSSTGTPQGTGDDDTNRGGGMSGKENASSGHSHNTCFSSRAGGPEQCQSRRSTKATPKAAASKCQAVHAGKGQQPKAAPLHSLASETAGGPGGKNGEPMPTLHSPCANTVGGPRSDDGEPTKKGEPMSTPHLPYTKMAGGPRSDEGKPSSQPTPHSPCTETMGGPRSAKEKPIPHLPCTNTVGGPGGNQGEPMTAPHSPHPEPAGGPRNGRGEPCTKTTGGPQNGDHAKKKCSGKAALKDLASTAHNGYDPNYNTYDFAHDGCSTASEASDTEDEGQPKQKRTRFANYTDYVTEATDDNAEDPTAAETMPGMLHHKAWEAATQNKLTEGNAAQHILHWIEIMNRGASAMARALDRERRCTHPRLVAFAMVPKLHGRIHLAHGFEEIILDDESHDADGCLGFFLGDRLMIHVEDGPHQQDLPFWMASYFTMFGATYHGKTAASKMCSIAERSPYQ